MTFRGDLIFRELRIVYMYPRTSNNAVGKDVWAALLPGNADTGDCKRPLKNTPLSIWLVRHKRPKRQKPLVILPLVAYVAYVAVPPSLIRELAMLGRPVPRRLWPLLLQSLTTKGWVASLI
jgi:hypothetical protein